MLILTFELFKLNIIRTKKNAELSSINDNFDFLTKEIVDDVETNFSVRPLFKLSEEIYLMYLI
jgi:hypothetical protein